MYIYIFSVYLLNYILIVIIIIIIIINSVKNQKIKSAFIPIIKNSLKKLIKIQTKYSINICHVNWNLLMYSYIAFIILQVPLQAFLYALLD